MTALHTRLKLSPEEFLYLEVLPALTAEEAGGFSRAAVRRRGVAVAATLSSSGEFRHFGLAECGELVAHLRTARCVVGYNCLAFDYELIRGQVAFRRPKTLDLMVAIIEAVGRRLPFPKACQIALGRMKVPTAEELAQAWRDGEAERVLSGLRLRLSALQRLHARICSHGLLDFAGGGSATEEKARRQMLDRATEEFVRSGNLPAFAVVRSAAGGVARVVPDIADGEDGMRQVVRRIETNR